MLAILGITVLAVGAKAQNVPSTTTGNSTTCSICAPPGWSIITGTPDMSNETTAATSETLGGGSLWTHRPLPLPPNDHLNWITIRDVGPSSTEEAISTTITGLTTGREYEVIAYTLSAVGGYSGQYIDVLDFQIDSHPRETINPINKDIDEEWGVTRFKFIADDTTVQIAFYPGNGAGGSQPVNFESVNISVTLNAINTIPVVEDKTATTNSGTPVIVNVLDGAMDYDAGQNVVVSSIDLDPSTPGIQNTITTSEGTWTVNHTTGDVTFTPATGFSGTATLPYTIQDNYVLDGEPSPGTSTPKNITVTVNAVDLDSDNDGILDCVEKGIAGEIDASFAFVESGDAIKMGPFEAQLTADVASQSGQLWSIGKVDFNESFTLEYEAFLGNHNGADGIATVFHNDPDGDQVVGIQGDGIGARGIQNGIVLELDTYRNGDKGELYSTHGQIWRSEDGQSFTSEIQLPEMEDGEWHPVVVIWDADTQTISYTVDGILAGTYTGDLINDIFGTNLVHFGYTASTGAVTNDQRIRFPTGLCDLPLELDTDNDGIPNHLDLDSDNDGCPDAMEGDGNISLDDLNADGTINSPEDENGVPTLADGGQEIGSAYDANEAICPCVKPGASGTPNGFSSVGILTKAKSSNNWPENIPNGYLVLDSAEKGMVIPHMNNSQRDALSPLDGMVIYNTDENCVQLYRGATPDTYENRSGWNCIQRGCNEQIVE